MSTKTQIKGMYLRAENLAKEAEEALKPGEIVADVQAKVMKAQIAMLRAQSAEARYRLNN